MKEVVIDQGGVLAVISDGTGELVAQIPRAQLQGRGLPEVGQGLKVMPGHPRSSRLSIGCSPVSCAACVHDLGCHSGVQ